jgi:hypothetical protein
MSITGYLLPSRKKVACSLAGCCRLRQKKKGIGLGAESQKVEEEERWKSYVGAYCVAFVALCLARHWLPNVLVPFLPPELFEPLLTLAADPAAREMHEQIAVPVSHVVAALHVGVELSLRVDADVIPYKLVLEHQVLERILLRTAVLLAHEHCVVGHHLQRPSRKGRSPEEG